MGGILLLFDFLNRRKWLLLVCILAIVLGAGATIKNIVLDDTLSAILPKDKKLDKIAALMSEAQLADKLVVTFSNESADSEALIQQATGLVHALDTAFEAGTFDSIMFQVNTDRFLEIFDLYYEEMPFYMEEADYQWLDSTIHDRIPFVVKSNFKQIIAPSGTVMKKSVLRDPLGISLHLVQKLRVFQNNENINVETGYFMSNDGKHLFLFLLPSKKVQGSEHSSAFLDTIRSLVNTASTTKVQTSLFGALIVADGNARQIQADIQLTVSIALVIIVVLISVYFRDLFVMLKLFVPVVLGAGVSLAVLVWYQDGIAAISLGIGSVIIGICIDFSLHIFTHYKYSGDKKEVLRAVTVPVIMSSLTTASAFMCLTLLQSQALQDLGKFAAGSVLFTALFALIILPHIFGLKHNQQRQPQVFFVGARVKKIVFWSIMALTIPLAFLAKEVGFDGQMEHLNYMSDAVQKAEQKLNRLTGVNDKTIYAVFEGRDMDEAMLQFEMRKQLFTDLKQEGKINSFIDFSLFAQSKKKRVAQWNRWKEFWSEEKILHAKTALITQGAKYKFKPQVYEGFFDFIRHDFAPETDQNQEIKSVLLSEYKIVQADKTILIDVLKSSRETEKIKGVYNQLPDAVGFYAFDKQIITNQLFELIRHDFDLLVSLSMGLVFMILLLFYGRIELTLITFIPIVMSWVWTLGWMALFGIQFNIVNIIICSFIMGLGIDYSIFTMSGLIEKNKYGTDNSGIYHRSILLSAITTIVGVGVLIFAEHPALSSIALISIIGITSVLFIVTAVQPVFFNYFIYNRQQKGVFPLSVLDVVNAFLVFGAIVCFSLFFSLYAVVFFFPPYKNPTFRVRFMEKGIKWMSYVIMNLPFKLPKILLNNEKERFEKPAIVVANHQSQVDIPFIFLNFKKIIVLTNKRVWNNPVFHIPIKKAGFVNIEDGVEKSFEAIKKKVEAGYSILVFPEGTRTLNGDIKRFHKGAFWLAEQLKMDVLPLVLHGCKDMLPKGTLGITPGQLTLKVLPRITTTDPVWENGYSHVSKFTCQLIRSEYARLVGELENVTYHRPRLLKNYIYKGPVLEWYVRIKTALERNFEFFDHQLPVKGKIVDLGCGYGYLNMMLSFRASTRELIGVDYDLQKIKVAQHCYSRQPNVQFVHADVLEHGQQEVDAFVLSDVLHYLTPQKQKALVQECCRLLKPGGMVLARDGNKEMKQRHVGTVLSEFFSTNFGFNKTENNLSFLGEQEMRSYIVGMEVTLEVIDQSKLTSNLFYCIRKANETEHTI